MIALCRNYISKEWKSARAGLIVGGVGGVIIDAMAHNPRTAYIDAHPKPGNWLMVYIAEPVVPGLSS